jgi:hypothetical protein
MNSGLEALATSAAIGAFALVAMGASSATAGKVICDSGCGPNGTFIPGSVGTIKSFHAVVGKTYNFTFTIGPPGNTQTLMQLAAAAFVQGSPLPIAFDLYGGTPGNPSYITSSNYQIDSTLSLPLTTGKYFMQLTPQYITQDKELVSGGIAVAAVPEPAAWSMMIMGLALMGAGLRQRRTAPALV